ncbi:MAG TPA: Uma2 family endonuclease [Blastocatellia bacterium]|nr:Uma2 family endonuclease [Blastocatellia bacterium]
MNGEILQMSPIGPRHAACVKRMNSLLTEKMRRRAVVSVQDPITVTDYSEPEPDLALLNPRDDFYAGAHPTSVDVQLIIEVADSTVETDRRNKIPMYAFAGIPEVWLIDLVRSVIEIHSNPHKGIYQEVRLIQRGQKIISPTLPQLKLKADDVLG